MPAFFDTAMIVGIFEQVLKILQLVFMVPLESRITRTGFFVLILRTDNKGSSISTVLLPTRIASTLLLSLWTLMLSIFEESFESPIRVAYLPSKVMAALKIVRGL